MTLHWWMHWFWITVTASSVRVSTEFIPALAAANPRVQNHQNYVSVFLPIGQRTHVGQTAVPPEKTKPELQFPAAELMLPRHHRDHHFELNNESFEQKTSEHNKYCDKHLQFLRFTLLHSKDFYLFKQACLKHFIDFTMSHSGIDITNIKILHDMISKDSSVLNHLFFAIHNKNKLSCRDRFNKPHPLSQAIPVTDFNSQSDDYKVFGSNRKSLFSGITSPYCASVLIKTFIPMFAKGETSGKTLAVPGKFPRDVENIQVLTNYGSENYISLGGETYQFVRRKRSVNVQSADLKHEDDNEFNVKSSTVRSKVMTEMLTESISNVYVSKVQKTGDVKSDAYFGNSKLGKWFNGLMKTFYNPHSNFAPVQAKNLNFTGFLYEFKGIPDLIKSLSLVLDIARHEKTENLSDNVANQIESIDKVDRYTSMQSKVHNVSTNLSNIHIGDSVQSHNLSTTNLPMVFVPTDASITTKVTVSWPTAETNVVLKVEQDKDGNSDGISLSETLNASSTASTDVLNMASTIATVEDEVDHVRSTEFASVVDDMLETASPGIGIAKEKILVPGIVIGSEKSSKAALITGIVLVVVIFVGVCGTVLFILFRRYFLNKPQTFNDKCSNPDSSGYIDDSTLRENSEEMYSLDNDSFLNSLEAMTIQNYWTDNVKHTKL